METESTQQQAELEHLRQEHRRLDEQIAVMENRHLITPTDEIEIKRLKRLKLHMKDQIAALSAKLSM